MKRSHLYLFLIGSLALGVMSGLWRWPMLDSFIWIFTGVTVFIFLANLTRKINFLDITALAACIGYLLMPLLTYNMYGKHDKMASLWRTFMTISKEEYFLLALPGTIALVLGLWLPSLIKANISDVQLVMNVKEYLKNKKTVGVIMVSIGLAAVPMVQIVPSALTAIFFFISQLTYIGALYLLHSGHRFKAITVVMILALMLVQTIMTGMYGELVYWSVMGIILLIVGKRSITMFHKVTILGIGIIILFFIQSIKHEYREEVWDGAKRGNDPAYFLALVVDRIVNPTSIFDSERIYRVVVRANQGFLVARTMEYVPKRESFANGETIIQSFFAAFIPRFIWADKPELGGREKICRFLGDCGRYTYSYNIGHLGEGYVNFGITGAWIFMFLYGYLINNLFNGFKYLSLQRPTLLLWIPMLFYAALVVETDVLTFLNSFVKGAIFCGMCYAIFKWLLRIRL